MTLWTPDGERRVERAAPDAGPAPASTPEPDDAPQLTEEEQARAEAIATEMAEVRRELASAPAAVVVANHAMGLYELAAIHLGQQPPNLSEAKVGIDAFGALVESLGDRLGPDAQTLHDALAQLRLAFVQLQASVDSPAPEPGSPG